MLPFRLDDIDIKKELTTYLEIGKPIVARTIALSFQLASDRKDDRQICL
jgi:hypothetical protein